jgi:dienelactone hydrolase
MCGNRSAWVRIGAHALCWSVVAVVVGSTASAAPAAVCGGFDWAFTQPAKSVYQTVSFKSQRFGGVKYRAILAMPNPEPPRSVPAVVAIHGNTKSPRALCGLFWATRFLASHGYVAITVEHRVVEKTDAAKLKHHIDALESAIAYLGSPGNPYRRSTNAHKIGLVGHSLGGAAISNVQATDAKVKAIVGFDNIRAYNQGDPGVVKDCQLPTAQPVMPRVPALGEGSESHCSTEGHVEAGQTRPDYTDKRFGFKAWRAHQIPTMETVMKGFTHDSFVAVPTSSAQAHNTADPHAVALKRAGYYMLAWFDYWIRGDQTGVSRLLDRTPDGVPLAHVLSSKQPASIDAAEAYTSSVFLPGIKQCDDFLNNCS